MFAKIKEEIKPLPKETVKLFNWAAYVKIAAVSPTAHREAETAKAHRG